MGQYAQNPRSLESSYKGVLFRSRLEARWAALFDHYGLMWAYEPDVFQTDVGKYLPDFYLPDQDCYVEVKPKAGMCKEIALLCVVKMTGANFLILDSSVIACRAYPILGIIQGSDEVEFWDMSWCASGKYLIGNNSREKRFYHCVEWANGGGKFHSGECGCEPFDGEPEHFRRIRSMRFERGVAL